MDPQSLIPLGRIDNMILLIRGERIILDCHLASLYGVSTKALIQAIKRNADRFPEEFAFQLTRQEVKELQPFLDFDAWGGRRYLPYAFTEHGAVMAANVLHSERAVKASLFIVKVFVKMRRLLTSHRELAQKLAELERQVGTHDKAIVSLFDAIRKLMAPLPTKSKKIGFILEP